MNGVRLPASALASLSLHAGIFGAYLFLNKTVKKENLRVISNVDLLVQVRKQAALPAPAVKAAKPPDAWNFLKMALPTIPEIPKAEMPQRMEVKLPEIHRTQLKEAEKLEDKGRIQKVEKLEALDLGHKRVEAAQIESKIEMKTHSANLATVPLLEEVGVRKVHNLPAAIALEERRQQAVAMQTIQGVAPAPSRHMAAAELAVLREATLAERGKLGDKMPTLLPQAAKIEMQPEAGPAPMTVKPSVIKAQPAVRHQETAGLESVKKKSIEIEGPLADRKVVYYEVPAFPSWARDQGLLEATVAIRFNVRPDGSVVPDMRVESTSGYGRLDRLAMDSLKKWKFAPISAEELQWGVITFRFLLE